MHIITVNHNNYAIVYNNQILITGISSDGSPIFSSTDYRRFYSTGAAYDFIRSSFETCLCTTNAPILGHFEQYTVQEVRTDFRILGSSVPLYESAWLALVNDEKTELIKPLLRIGVQNGFKTLGLCIEQVRDFLQSSKYEDIVKSVVPRHIIGNLEMFMDSGLCNCTDDELGAILLTSSDEVLKYIQFDTYNISR